MLEEEENKKKLEFLNEIIHVMIKLAILTQMNKDIQC